MYKILDAKEPGISANIKVLMQSSFQLLDREGEA